MATPPHYYLDALREMVTTGMGKAAASLNTLLHSPIELDVPSIATFNPEDLSEVRKVFGDDLLSCVWIGFHGTFTGTALFVLPPENAATLVAELINDKTPVPNLYAVMAETLTEVGNIVVNCIIGTIGNALAKPFEFSIPYYIEGSLRDLLKQRSHIEALTILLIRAGFRTGDRRIEGSIFLAFELRSFDRLVTAVNEAIPRQGT